MAATPFAAFSVHHFVSSVGADAGFAAFVAVAILVLLYFAHARETATLRTRANEADMRIQELEAELAELSEQVAAIPAEISVRAASPRAAAAYGAAQPAGQVAEAVGQGSWLPPAAPAGVGGPALAAATRLIPDPTPALPEYEPATAAGGNGNGAARPVVAASAATAQRPVPAPAGGTARPVGAPQRVGGGGGGRPGGGPGAGQGRPPRPGQPRPGTPARPPGAPLRPPPRRSRGRVAAGVLVGVLALAAVVVGVIALTGGNNGASSSKSSSASNAALRTRRNASSSAVVRPATVTVSVLNGTDLQGLAGKIANQLATAGYQKGSKPTNAADQTHTSTIVAYMAAADRRDALAVAKSLKLPVASVQSVDPATKATVCPPGQACTSAVVVTVGTDLAHQ
jgi:LytR cell envelope-related transcriptional attenuator